jgi:hypothetical protein
MTEPFYYNVLYFVNTPGCLLLYQFVKFQVQMKIIQDAYGRVSLVKHWLQNRRGLSHAGGRLYPPGPLSPRSGEKGGAWLG